jgi:hypothetical protein
VWSQVGADINGVLVRPVLYLASASMTSLDTSCDGQGGSLVLFGLHRICVASGQAMSQACLVYGGLLSFGNGGLAAPLLCRQAKDMWMLCGTGGEEPAPEAKDMWMLCGTGEEEPAPEVLCCAVCILFVCGFSVRTA